jgi:Flp pilus assembly pilin Flp
MKKFLMRVWPEEEAQDLSEYALLLFLVCLAAVSTVAGLSSKVNSVYSNASTHMTVTASSASLTGGSLGYTSEAPDVPKPNPNDKSRKPDN